MILYIDVASGTYGFAGDLEFIDISDWENDELEALHEATNSERISIAHELNDLEHDYFV